MLVPAARRAARGATMRAEARRAPRLALAVLAVALALSDAALLRGEEEQAAARELLGNATGGAAGAAGAAGASGAAEAAAAAAAAGAVAAAAAGGGATHVWGFAAGAPGLLEHVLMANLVLGLTLTSAFVAVYASKQRSLPLDPPPMSAGFVTCWLLASFALGCVGCLIGLVLVQLRVRSATAAVERDRAELCIPSRKDFTLLEEPQN